MRTISLTAGVAVMLAVACDVRVVTARTLLARRILRITMSFPIPANEPERLGAVRALNILDTAPDIAYDEIGELA